MKKYGLTLIVFIIALLPLTYWAYDYAYYKWFGPQLEVGSAIPDFKIEDLNGQKVSREVLNGKIGILVFFAHWCPSCRQELPHIQREVWEKYKDNPKVKLMVIARAIDRDTIRNFVAKNAYTFPTYTDPGRKAYRTFARKYIPRTYVIGRDGRILWSSRGYNPDEFGEMLRCIEANL